jgi:hypothetical protein
MPTALITALKGAGPLDYIMILAVLLLGSWMGWWELRRRKPGNPNADRHSMCIADIDTLITEKREIKYFRVIKEQMKICESMVEEVSRLMRDRFFRELSGALGSDENVLRSLDNVHYNNVVSIFGSRAVEDLRRMMRDNGLAEKSDAELRAYIHSHVAEFIELGRNVFDVYYSSNDQHTISRSRVHDMHKELFGKAAEIFSSTIWECRRIAMEGSRRILEIDAEIDSIRSKPCQGGSG